MAYETGSATDHQDLFTKLKTFLTTHADLVAASEEWAVAWEAAAGDPNPTAIVLQGPGLGGTDEVLVGLRLVEDDVNARYGIEMTGMTGLIPSATILEEHINVTPTPVVMFADSNPMTYWFVANGRRFIAVVKISTVFESMYGGLFLPYAPPTAYSYPMFIGGSCGVGGAGNALDWRSVDISHSHFPYASRYTNNPVRNTGAWMITPQGDWLQTGVNGELEAAIGPMNMFSGMWAQSFSNGNAYGYRDLTTRMRAAFDDTFPLTKLTLVQADPADATFGVLDGAYHTPGDGNSSENIITIGSVDHLVVQNAFRTGPGDYWALKLE